MSNKEAIEKRYNQKMERVLEGISFLQELLKQHKPPIEDIHYGYLGDLDYIESLLGDATDFLGEGE